MRAALDAAPGLVADRAVWLGTNGENARAQAFYRKHGFAVAGSRTYVVGGESHDDVVMVRPLGCATARRASRTEVGDAVGRRDDGRGGTPKDPAPPAAAVDRSATPPVTLSTVRVVDRSPGHPQLAAP